MRLSPGAEIIVSIAVAEARLIESTEMDPEHIFLALLKAEDLLPERREAGSEDALYEALSEMQGIATFWKKQGISAKRLRRRLRYLVRESQQMRGQFSGHRSSRGRELFERCEVYAARHVRQSIDSFIFLIGCLEISSAPIAELFSEFKIDRRKLLAAAQEQIAHKEPPTEESGIWQEHPLSRYGRDLTALARSGRIGPVIGRDEEIKQVARILVQRGKNNPLLLGEAGVGKTAVVEGLALYAVSANAIAPLSDLHFVEISIAALLSGAMYRGQFEERIQEVIREAQKDRNLIIFMDELHTLIGSGAGENSALDAANMLKPALARGDIRCIGATTIDEYRKHIEPDNALARRFQIVWIDEPTPAETLQILQGLRPGMQEHHQLEIPDAVLEKVVALSGRYITEGYQPDKAITVLDEACAQRRLLTIHRQRSGERSIRLEIEDIGRVVARRTRIPEHVILLNDEERLLRLEEELSKRVLGQDAAVRVVAEAVRISRAGLRMPGKPVVLMFAGPTGTGKTELAKALSETLFFDADRLITLDMSEYQESHSVSKLIGSPPGYVGFGDEPYLVRELRLHPYSVVLLDEIDKAHPGVLTVFLQAFDEGRLTDARGRRIHCGDAIFILTSNLGADISFKQPIGFKPELVQGEDDNETSRRQTVENAIIARLSPELVNRLQAIVVFRPLDRSALCAILDRYVEGLNQQLTERNIAVELDDTARDLVLQQGYSPEFGARHLRRTFERLVAEPLSRAILSAQITSGQRACFLVQEGHLILRISTNRGIRTVVYQPHPEKT